MRQGSVLSPFLFAMLMTSVLCVNQDPIYIIVYADDILLLAPTVTTLDKLLHACERELPWLDMLITCKKSFCLRVGQRCDAVCANVVNYLWSIDFMGNRDKISWYLLRKFQIA